ncbi:MAG: hypothetical protein M3Z16_04240 [Pseudomonadota bacterium]|nr:hypothetical protein [Pseudomonadota bacterium]
MTQIGRIELARRGSLFDVEPLIEPLFDLVGEIKGRNATIVLESAFAPVLLADTGGALWNRSQLDALLRHRLEIGFGGPDAAIGTWGLRTDYRFGDRFALASALPPAVTAVLRRVEEAAGIRSAAWLPSLTWGIDRFAPWRRWPDRKGIWAWCEQDRFVVARLEGRMVTALHPASDLVRGITTEVLSTVVDPNGTEGADLPSAVGEWGAVENTAIAPLKPELALGASAA